MFSSLIPLRAGALIALVAPLAAGQTLVENINQVPSSSAFDIGDSSATEFVQVGSRVYFSAFTEAEGRELWSMPLAGGAPTLVADLEPGPEGSNPKDLVALPGDRLFFVAGTTTFGREPWVTDGTQAGTSLLGDLIPGDGDSLAREATAFNGEVWFYALGFATGGTLSLWRTDGTVSGTSSAFDLGLSGSWSLAEQQIEAAGPWLYFSGSQDTTPSLQRWQLFRTDGSAGGIQLLHTQEDAAASGTEELVAAGSNVALIAGSLAGGRELWVSDGTPSGTVSLDIEPGAGGSTPRYLTAVGNEVYFVAQAPVLGAEIHRTDGTPGGTALVTDTPGSGFGGPLWLFDLNGQILFSAPTPGEGYELWISDGSFDAEVPFAVLNPGAGDSTVLEAAPLGGGVVCAADNDLLGRELWFSDGTPGGTFLLADIKPGDAGSFPAELTTIGNQVFFTADEILTEREVWTTDGTSGGTQLVADIAKPQNDGSSFPRLFTSLGDRMLFVADDGIHGDEIWVSDGTPGDAELLLDINANPSDFGPRQLVRLGNEVLFSADDGAGDQLWKTDGTVAGTQRLTQLGNPSIGADPFILGELDGYVYFAARVTFSNFDLYRTDATVAGTEFVSSVAPTIFFNAENSIEFDGWLYFLGDGGDGRELWRVQGTTAEQVIDLNLGSGGIANSLAAAVYLDRLYFAADDGVHGAELWRTDGSAAGTELVADLNPGSSSWPRELEVVNGRLLFLARTLVDEFLVAYDGSQWTELTDSSVVFRSGWPLMNNGEQVMSVVTTGGVLRVLYGSDGTPAGTGVIQPITNTSAAFANLRWWKPNLGSKVLFASADEFVGSELWVTDGTAAGTASITDSNPGPVDSDVEDVGRFGDQVYFYALSPNLGYELWTIPILEFGPVAEPFGAGCAGSSGETPTLGVEGLPSPGEAFTLRVDNAAPGALVAHFTAFDYALSDVGGCSIHLSNPILTLQTFTDGSGTSSVPLALPPEPTLVGLNVWWQSLVTDSGGALNGVAALTPALEVWIGE